MDEPNSVQVLGRQATSFAIGHVECSGMHVENMHPAHIGLDTLHNDCADQ